MKNLIRIIGVGMLPLIAAGLAWPGQQTLQEGATAPTFELTADDGQTYSLDVLRAEAPVFLVFWKERCPSNYNAVPFFHALVEAYGNKVNLLGVVSGPQERLGNWISEYGANFRILPDPDKILIGAYGLSRSIVTFQVGTDGKIAKVFPGYGREALTALNEALARAAQVEPATVDLSSAPNRTAYG